jgi:aromatic-ring opening dioxygenase LigAB LigA subunit
VSAYAVNKLARLTLHDLSLREQMRSDPEAVVASFAGLSDEERAALLAGQVGRLHELGAHSFLLGYLARYGLVGLTQEIYAERMRASRGPVAE